MEALSKLHRPSRSCGMFPSRPKCCPFDFEFNLNFRVKTFKIGVYPPAILPMLAVYGTHNFLSPLQSMFIERHTVSLAMEAIGDITASAEVSRLDVDGVEFDSRIQGGVLVSPTCYYNPWEYH